MYLVKYSITCPPTTKSVIEQLMSVCPYCLLFSCFCFRHSTIKAGEGNSFKGKSVAW